MFLVCKRFNGIISNSSRLMEKIKLVFNFDKIPGSTSYTRSAKRDKLKDPHDLFKTKRNYQILSILNFDYDHSRELENCLEIFKKIQNIKMLSLDSCYFRDPASLCLIFRNWIATLKEIKLCSIFFQNDNENISLEPLEINRLKKVVFIMSGSTFGYFLPIFSKSKLNK